MKKNRTAYRIMIIILALSAVLTGAVYGTAGSGRPPRGGGGGPLMHCIDQLALSPETRAKVEALVQNHTAGMTAERDRLKSATEAYYAALTAARKDGAALARAQQAILELERKRTESRFALENSVVALLSADEAARLGTCMNNAQQEFPGGPPAFGGKAGSR